ncbi:MAG: hypothetical protein HZB52_14965, partial [Chloroflexi bacterium]|nr:hypothetical protein [Chloroflexota bacterium]
MSKIVTVDQMKQLETEADARGVSYAQMMDYAGAAVADSILRRIQRPEGFHPLRFATGRL